MSQTLKNLATNLSMLFVVCMITSACGPISISAEVPEIPLPQIQVTMEFQTPGGSESSSAPQPTSDSQSGDGSAVDPNAVTMLGYVLVAIAGAFLLIALFALLRRPDRPNDGSLE